MSSGLVAGAAQATPSAQYVVAGSFEVADVVLKDGCFYHPYVVRFETTPSTDMWAVNVRLLAPDGTVSDMSLKTGSGWAGGRYAEETFLCEGIDDPGTYTLTGKVSTFGDDGEQEALMTPSSFQVLPLPAVPVADVTGTVTSQNIQKGVKLVFQTGSMPAGSVQGAWLSWKVVYDGRTKRIKQGWNERYPLPVKFKTGSGKHVIGVYRNGALVKTVRVRR